MAVDHGWLEIAERDGLLVVEAGGLWNLGNVARLDAEIRKMPAPGPRPVHFDISEVKLLDTAGAWTLYRTARDWEAAGARISIEGGNAEQVALLETVRASDRPFEPTATRFRFTGP